jgi:hypothetical protein
MAAEFTENDIMMIRKSLYDSKIIYNSMLKLREWTVKWERSAYITRSKYWYLRTGWKVYPTFYINSIVRPLDYFRNKNEEEQISIVRYNFHKKKRLSKLKQI